MKDYLDDHKLRLWDFFRNIDKDGTMRVPVADFRRAMQVCGESIIPLKSHTPIYNTVDKLIYEEEMAFYFNISSMYSVKL